MRAATELAGGKDVALRMLTVEPRALTFEVSYRSRSDLAENA
jgi:hypothetical protein